MEKTKKDWGALEVEEGKNKKGRLLPGFELPQALLQQWISKSGAWAQLFDDNRWVDIQREQNWDAYLSS